MQLNTYNFLQCGQRARELFKVLNRNESAQWAQFTLAIPKGTAGSAGLGAKLIILLPTCNNDN